jgi:hypothetical protein
MAEDQKKKYAEMINAHRAAMGVLRKAHFEAGGDLVSWRGRGNVYIDKQKQRSKYKCRGRVRSDKE